MLPHKARRGISPVLIVVTILILAALGVGGYFSYILYLEPMINPYGKLIPEGLNLYARGADADGFIIIKKDQDVKRILKGLPVPSQFSDFKAAIILASAAKQTVVAIIEFGSKEGSMAFVELVKSLNTNNIEIALEEKENILTISYGKGLTAFSGLLIDNPNIKLIDPKMADSQVIIALDVAKLAEIATLPDSILNEFIQMPKTPSEITGAESPKETISSPGNSLQVLVKSCFIYLRVIDDNLTARLVVKLLPENEISNSPAKKIVTLWDSNIDIAGIEKNYDDHLKMISDGIPKLQEELDRSIKPVEGATVKAVFADNTLDINFNTLFSKLEKYGKQTFATSADASSPEPNEGPSRDSKRKSDLNKIGAAIEAYHLDKGAYPKDSGCTYTLPFELTKQNSTYYDGISAPTDPDSTSRIIGTSSCWDGYYYQSFGDKGFILWAKMDDTENGNTSLSPEELGNILTAGQIPQEETSGIYFIKNMLAGATDAEPPSSTTDDSLATQQTATQQTTTPIKRPKIKRTP